MELELELELAAEVEVTHCGIASGRMHRFRVPVAARRVVRESILVVVSE